MAFSENLQSLRARANITQEQLAEKLDVSRQSVSKWESGVSYPEMDTLLRICDLYDVNLDALLRGTVDPEADTAGYDRHMNVYTRQVMCSVFAIIAGVGLLLFTQVAGLPEQLGAALYLLIVTCAVVVLVASGIRHNNFRKKYPTLPDLYSQEEKDAFHGKFVWLVSGGVGAILAGVVGLVLTASLPVQEELRVGCFLLVVACAVAAFIYAGMQEDKYKLWKYNRDNNPTPEAKRKLDLIGVCCGCVMLAATAAFLTMGFTRDAWGTAWWVYPVGGVLCGIAAVALDPYRGEG